MSNSGSNFVVYNTDGKIVRVGYCPSNDVSLQAKENETVMETEDVINSRTHYVSNGQITERTELSSSWNAETVAADGTTEIVLSDLPVPCTVYVNGDEVTVDDGSLEFSTSDSGFYHVAIDEPAYLGQEWVINAI
jgi:hypothetical protein